MIPVPIRLRRAIHLDDLSLVKRIVKNNPKYLQNPDLDDNGNTSLHLAVKLGLLDITEFLISAHHESHGPSRNFTLSTPLHTAIASPSPHAPAVSTLLATRFPATIALPDGAGATPLHLCARTPHASLLPVLLSLAPAQMSAQQLLEARDNDGNTALHYASAWGQLKCVRGLLERGASAGARNSWSWTPVSYSCSVQAEVYFRALVGEGVGQVQGQGRGRRERGGAGGGVRLVEGEEETGR